MTDLSVFGWAADQGGCGYYRIGLPLWALREYHGIHAEASVVIPQGAMREAKVIIGQRVCNPGPSSTWQQLAKLGNNALVFEVDDNLWRIHHANENAYPFFSRPEIQQNLKTNIPLADMVTVTNDTLANVIQEMFPGANVAVIGNYINNDLRYLERPKRDKLTIGWSGSSTHRPDFEYAARPLMRFFRKFPDVDMHFVGTTYEALIRKPSRGTPWTNEVEEYYKGIDFDIGVIPLAYVPFNRSKSPIKALEYAAMSIPVIASDFGPYSDFVKHGETGFLVRKDHEWFEYLRLLVNDEALRAKMGAAGREQAGNYTIQGNAHLWKDAYETLI